MPTKINELRRLERELTKLRTELARIRVEYQDPDPPDGLSDAHWESLITSDLSHPLGSRQKSFGDAWFVVCKSLDSAIDGEQIGKWAWRFLELSGLRSSFSEFPDPPIISPRRQVDDVVAITELTGSGNVIIAGQRIMFWLAASHWPRKCQRSEQFPRLFVRWRRQLVQWHGGLAWVFFDFVDWIESAVREIESMLASQETESMLASKPIPIVTETRDVPRHLTDVFAKLDSALLEKYGVTKYRQIMLEAMAKAKVDSDVASLARHKYIAKFVESMRKAISEFGHKKPKQLLEKCREKESGEYRTNTQSCRLALRILERLEGYTGHGRSKASREQREEAAKEHPENPPEGSRPNEGDYYGRGFSGA